MGLFGPSKKERLLQEQNEVLQKEVIRLSALITPEQKRLMSIQDEINEKEKKVVSLEGEIQSREKTVEDLMERISLLEKEIAVKREQISIFDEEMDVQEYGLYKPFFVFANSDLYKDRLAEIRSRQKEYIKSDRAAVGSTMWTVDGNRQKGAAMVRDTKKLLLRAFNVECDDIVANVKVSNLEKSIERIRKISDQISKLGRTMSICITRGYIDLKIEEVKLALDFQQKKQEEKELQRELRAQEREEVKVRKEIEEERKRLKKEQTHYQNALNILLEQIAKNGKNEELMEKKRLLESQIEDTCAAIENVDYREANQRAGYVYIISNIGAFGENVYKIGMTRRLDPHERVYELSDASVPFNFDIHALIFTDDAPGLETALHNAFESRKINKINTRREFFAVTLDEIKAEVRKNFDRTVEWIDVPEAEQYRQSLLLS